MVLFIVSILFDTEFMCQSSLTAGGGRGVTRLPGRATSEAPLIGALLLPPRHFLYSLAGRSSIHWHRAKINVRALDINNHRHLLWSSFNGDAPVCPASGASGNSSF